MPSTDLDRGKSAAATPGTALVTGASSGIGLAFAERLARDGWNLVLVARSRERLEELAKSLRSDPGVEVEVLVADLIAPEGRTAVEDRIRRDTPNLLVNNAGFGTTGRFAELDPQGEEDEIQLNVLALTRLTRAALPAMLERGAGSIVNVSSLAGLGPSPFNATYGATKSFVNSFTEAVAAEIRGSGVRIQVLLPGFTRTEFQQRAGFDATAVPSAAWMLPEDVVAASLKGLERGQLVCVPGLGNQLLGGVQRVLPRSLVARGLAAFSGRSHG